MKVIQGQWLRIQDCNTVNYVVASTQFVRYRLFIQQ